MEDIQLEDITIKQFKEEIYPYYIEMFPEEERKSIGEIKRAYKKGYVRIIKIVYQSQMVGFMTINRVRENGYIVLDYLAILKQYRNQQFGTKALKLLFKEEKESKGIFIEIEKIGLGKNEKENIKLEKKKINYEETSKNDVETINDLY